MSLDSFIIAYPFAAITVAAILIIFTLLAPLYVLNKKKMRTKVSTNDGFKLIAAAVIFGTVILAVLYFLPHIFFADSDSNSSFDDISGWNRV